MGTRLTRCKQVLIERTCQGKAQQSGGLKLTPSCRLPRLQGRVRHQAQCAVPHPASFSHCPSTTCLMRCPGKRAFFPELWFRERCLLQAGPSAFSGAAHAGEPKSASAVNFSTSAASLAAIESPFKEVSPCFVHPWSRFCLPPLLYT